MTVRAPKPWTVAGFLEWERTQPERYEFVDGVIRMMTGGTNAHSRLKGNLFGTLFNRLNGTACEPFVEGPKVATQNAVLYPDVVVTCGQVNSGDDRIPSPTVIIEVLSRSTANDDRGDKWLAYQEIDSLQHYVLVEQRERRVDLYTRTSIGWQLLAITGTGQVELPAIGCYLTLDEIYKKVLEP